jgi:hypothetical protein
MPPEVPKGKSARYLYVLACTYGHQWFAYGEEDQHHWGPAQCRECLNAYSAIKVVRTLTAAEGAALTKYHVVMDARLALGTPMDAQTEEDVDAETVRETVSHCEFLVGDVVVQRFPKNWVIGKPTLAPPQETDAASTDKVGS